MKTQPTNLETLLVAIQAGKYSDQEMAELPTFGGEEPRSTNGVFSWDDKRMLVQNHIGWSIVARGTAQS